MTLIDWGDIGNEQSSKCQRQALYKFLLRDREQIKNLIRRLSFYDAQTLLEIFIHAVAETPTQADVDGWEHVT